ncbi:MAG: riboflavin kinase [Candidatus Aenigmarchaeota archaeon]|nr:riboflavin kinase [Candidatus Aenigmarchaeota archaeon]
MTSEKVTGIVVEGDKRGRLIEFPTANIKADDLPPAGVYAVLVHIEGRTMEGVANVGTALTFGRKKPVAEVHIFGFSGELYGKEISMDFIRKIRDERKFPGVKELKEQIIRDCEEAKRILLSEKHLLISYDLHSL